MKYLIKQYYILQTILVVCMLISCNIYNISEVQSGVCVEWRSGISVPEGWPLVPISTDTLVTPYFQPKNYPEEYSDKIVCIYYNGRYAVRLDSLFILIPQDTINEQLNEGRFYVDSYMFNYTGTDSICYAMTYIPKEDRNRYYILDKNFDIPRFKTDPAYREFVKNNNITIYEKRELFISELNKKGIIPTFERVVGWDPEPDSIRCVSELQRAVRDLFYNVTSFHYKERKIHRYTHGFYNTILPISDTIGKLIDENGIVDYSCDTVYILQESAECNNWIRNVFIKNKTGLYEIVRSQQCRNDTVSRISWNFEDFSRYKQKRIQEYYNNVFNWGNLRNYILDNWNSKELVESELIRIVIRNYKIEYVDLWKYDNIILPIMSVMRS